MNRLGSGLFSLLIAIVLLLAGTFPVSAIDRTAIADNPPAAASTPSPSQLIESAPQAIPEPAAVNFNIWYEGNLRFGQLGNPQPIINIMGNAAAYAAAGGQVPHLDGRRVSFTSAGADGLPDGAAPEAGERHGDLRAAGARCGQLWLPQQPAAHAARHHVGASA